MRPLRHISRFRSFCHLFDSLRFDLSSYVERGYFHQPPIKSHFAAFAIGPAVSTTLRHCMGGGAFGGLSIGGGLFKEVLMLSRHVLRFGVPLVLLVAVV